MGLSIDRQFKTCATCGGKIQVDTIAYPGQSEDAPAVTEEQEMHIGSCSPLPSSEVIADNSNVTA
jgi:hypothetical protein